MKILWFVLALVFGVFALLYLIDLIYIFTTGLDNPRGTLIYTFLPLVATGLVFWFSQEQYKKLKKS